MLGVLGLQWERGQEVMYSPQSISCLGWPGLAWPPQDLPNSCLMPNPSVLAPSAGGRACSALSDKTSLPAFPGILLPVPSVCGIGNINKARLQSGGKLVSKGGPGNWGIAWGLEAQDENTTSQEFVLKLSPEILLDEA